MSRLLVVEDHPDALEYFEELLREAGYRVTIASDGLVAWEILTSHDPGTFSLVITDIVMPRMNGIELIKRIRLNDDLMPIRIIAITADNSYEVMEACFQAGCDDFMKKALDIRELLIRVRSLIKDVTILVDPDDVQEEFCVRIDKIGMRAKFKDRTVLLTPSEFKIMEYLDENRESVLTSSQILREALGYANGAGSLEIVRNHIRKVREKLKFITNQEVIQTIGKKGYKLASSIAWENEGGE